MNLSQVKLVLFSKKVCQGLSVRIFLWLLLFGINFNLHSKEGLEFEIKDPLASQMY